MKKLVSGGQTGGDQAGLVAGVTLGLETGGWAPRGWRTQDGPAPWLSRFGLKEHPVWGYPPRTRENVKDSDGTFWFGNPGSPGGRLTLRTCAELQKPSYVVIWPSAAVPLDKEISSFRAWLHVNNIQTLNVAGNRENTNPGITDACVTFLVKALKKQ